MKNLPHIEINYLLNNIITRLQIQKLFRRIENGENGENKELAERMYL